MKSYRRLTSVFAAAAGVFILAIALGLNPALAQKRGGELHTVVFPEPAHLGLGISPQIGTYVISSKIYQSLMKYDFDLNPIPVLATEWSPSSDGKTSIHEKRLDVAKTVSLLRTNDTESIAKTIRGWIDA